MSPEPLFRPLTIIGNRQSQWTFIAFNYHMNRIMNTINKILFSDISKRVFLSTDINKRGRLFSDQKGMPNKNVTRTGLLKHAARIHGRPKTYGWEAWNSHTKNDFLCLRVSDLIITLQSKVWSIFVFHH